MIPQNIKNCKSLQEFKKLIKILQIEHKVRCKYLFHLIKHILFIRYTVFHYCYLLLLLLLLLFCLALIRHTYHLVLYFFKLTVNKVFNSIQKFFTKHFAFSSDFRTFVIFSTRFLTSFSMPLHPTWIVFIRALLL